MASSTAISIEISLAKSSYYVGEDIRGFCHVISNLHERYPADNLQLTLHGVVGVGKIRKSKEGKNKESRRKTSEILKFKQLLAIQDGALYPGSHQVIPFSVQIPNDPRLLPSIELQYGYVRYWLDATFPKQWAQTSSTLAMCSIKIFNVVDPNAAESAVNPPRLVLHINPLCTCCGCAANLSATLDRTVYLPGEIVKLHCEVQNNSGKLLNPYVQMQEVVKFHNIELTASPRKILLQPATDFLSYIPPRYQGPMNILVRIPTRLKLCPTMNHELIQCSYKISIGAKMARSSEIISKEVPITLGTVPYRLRELKDLIGKDEKPQLQLSQKSPVMDIATLSFLTDGYSMTKMLPKYHHLPESVTSRLPQCQQGSE